MPMSARDLSVGVFVRGLTNMKGFLMKGEAHASANGMDPVDFIKAQLAPDMQSLAAQVHWAGEGARISVDRLLGATAAAPADEAKSFAELFQRIDATLAYLGTIELKELEAGLARTIEIEHRGRSMKFVGSQFLLEFAIPSFFFHVTTAYCILRHQGVQVTKGDFIGALG
jgi:hypothetical protein